MFSIRLIHILFRFVSKVWQNFIYNISFALKSTIQLAEILISVYYTGWNLQMLHYFHSYF